MALEKKYQILNLLVLYNIPIIYACIHAVPAEAKADERGDGEGRSTFPLQAFFGIYK